MELDFSIQDVSFSLAPLQSQELGNKYIEDKIEYNPPEQSVICKWELFYRPLDQILDSNPQVASFISVKDRKTVTASPYPRMVYVKCNRSDCNNPGLKLHPHFREIHYHTTICIKHYCRHYNEKDCVVVQCIETYCNST
jgi:hypothetical protein